VARVGARVRANRNAEGKEPGLALHAPTVLEPLSGPLQPGEKRLPLQEKIHRAVCVEDVASVQQQVAGRESHKVVSPVRVGHMYHHHRRAWVDVCSMRLPARHGDLPRREHGCLVGETSRYAAKSVPSVLPAMSTGGAHSAHGAISSHSRCRCRVQLCHTLAKSTRRSVVLQSEQLRDVSPVTVDPITTTTTAVTDADATHERAIDRANSAIWAGDRGTPLCVDLHRNVQSLCQTHASPSSTVPQRWPRARDQATQRMPSKGSERPTNGQEGAKRVGWPRGPWPALVSTGFSFTHKLTHKLMTSDV
jgi:hypothetical protein